MAYCINCGSLLPSGAKFCSNCGTATEGVNIDSQRDNKRGNKQDSNKAVSEALFGLVSAARNSVNNAITQFKNEGYHVGLGYSEPKSNEPVWKCGFEQDEAPTITNCPNCGAPVNSFAARCQNCGTELNNKARATACQNLCDRLNIIESNRPKETLASFAFDLANKALSNHKISSTDQQKIELIGSFVIPNTKADMLEFIFLAQTQVKSCHDLANSTSDINTALAQNELEGVWKAKLEQTIEKARIVLSDDPDFLAVEKNYQIQKNKEKGVCQYCGGKFKGMFTKVCVNCGRIKDY